MSIGRDHPVSRIAQRAAVASAVVMVASLALAPTSSADPDSPDDTGDKPTISEVEQRLNVLNHEGEIASEKLNAARVEMKAAQQRLDTLDADVTRQTQRVEKLRGQVIGGAVESYQTASSMSPTTAFFTADDAGQLLQDMATNAMVEDQQAGLLVRLGQQQKQLVIREQAAQDALEALSDDKTQAAEHQAELDGKVADAEELLGELETEERERLLAAQATAPHPDVDGQEPTSREEPRLNITDVPVSDRASIAVETALAQLGDPYVYGAAGPDSFDCSGLTMYAWAAAGVSIPHASSMQPSAGTPVSMSSLQPGDLIFFYSPISHVGMYIGNGQIVHAPHTGSYVQVVPVSYMPVAMAVRIA